MPKHLIYIYTIVLSLLACSENKTPQSQMNIDTLSTLTMQIQRCSKLYGTEIQIHKIITHSDNKSIKATLLQKSFNIELPMSDRKVAIPMDFTLKSYVDFSTFTPNNIKREQNKIEIILPDPQITLIATKINHKDIRKQISFIRSDFTENELYEYAKQGRQAVINDIPQMNIITKTQANIAQILIPMLKQMGYEEKNITISFRKELNEQNILQLIKMPNSEKISQQ